MRLGNGPRCHKHAIAPATDTEAVRIGNASPDQFVNARKDVLKILAAEVSVVHQRVFDAAAYPASEVGQQNGVAMRRKELSPCDLKPVQICAFRPAVRKDDQRTL